MKLYSQIVAALSSVACFAGAYFLPEHGAELVETGVGLMVAAFLVRKYAPSKGLLNGK